MKIENLRKPSFLCTIAFFVAMLLLSTTLINAQVCTTQTFAQFQQNPASNAFTFNRNAFPSTPATFTGTSQAIFQYSNIVNLPAELQGPQQATVTINASTTAPAQLGLGNRTIQPFTGNFTITITRGSPASIGTGSRTNLLTAVVINTPNVSELSGDTGTAVRSAGYSASTSAQQIIFTSDFINFNNTFDKDLALSFSSIVQRFFADQPGVLPVETFTAAGTGTFATCPAPSFFPPTAASAGITGRVLTPSGSGLAKAQVVLTDSNGETFVTLTNSFGYYRFSDIEAGQSVIISVRAKRYSYAPKVLNVGEDLYESDFIPE